MLILLRAIGGTLGWLAFVLGVRRRVTEENLERAFPELTSAEIRRLNARCFRNLGTVFFEFLFLRTRSQETILNGIEVNDLALTTSLASSSEPTILLSGHFGNWEWTALGFGILLHKPLSLVVKNQRSGRAEEFLRTMRHRFGNVSVNAGDVRAIYKCLANNATLVILSDQAAPAESTRVEFFGRQVPTFEGTARLALRSRARIIFAQPLARTSTGYKYALHEVSYEDLIESTPENIQELTRRHTALLEHCIRMNPELWLWQHKRWKYVREAG